MKKIISLLLILLAVTFSMCACEDNYENSNISGNTELQNSVSTNQNEDDGTLNNESADTDNQEISTEQNDENQSGETQDDEMQSSETQNSGEKVDKQQSNETQSISVSTTALSNEKCAWGFVRKKDSRPEIYAPYAKVLDKFDGIYLGNSEEKVIYLTFDEGYENGYTTTILDTLKEKDCPATFFVTMPYVKQNPDLVQRMIDEGHIVGNHSVNHPSMPEVTDDEKVKNEVLGLHDYVKENFDYEMEFFRPPKGEYSERTVAICKELGYRNVLWSSAYADWDVNNQKGSEYAKNMILNYLHNGCVMLLHAVSKDNDAVLGEVIDEIRNRGYEIRPLSEFKS